MLKAQQFRIGSESLSLFKKSGFVVIAMSMILAASAQAVPLVPGLYQLFDHGDGHLGPDYGIRSTALGKLFSFELGAASVTLDWDGGLTAQILGTVHDNDTGDLWDLEYTISNIVLDPDGFVSMDGLGSLTDPLNNVTVLEGEANGSGYVFLFLADGHRLDNDNSTPVGRGWLLPPGSVDDFLFRAELIPEPATLALLSIGAMGLIRRRRKG
jgi:hypothetical protein